MSNKKKPRKGNGRTAILLVEVLRAEKATAITPRTRAVGRGGAG